MAPVRNKHSSLIDSFISYKENRHESNHIGFFELNLLTLFVMLYDLDFTYNGTARFKKCKQCFECEYFSYLETSRGQSSNLYLNAVHFFNTSVN